ncbi:porin [Andreprevotia chitinilytica]|uniref:porin n=1 Tax=Andreprevotia chitinilytica TaxID=396808 RepID=UPI001B80BC5A|nr:porin [Andreprevotia chitinilytica]
MQFKRKSLYVIMLGCFYASAPAFADEISDLKAEIAAQKKHAAEQQAQLDALEKKLDASIQSQQKVAANAPSTPDVAPLEKHPVWGTPGYTGLTYHTAKDTISLYGLIDLTASNINHTDSSGGRTTSFHPTGWFSGSRWGLDGSHKLTDNTRVIYRLESEYEMNTGNMDTPGTLFNRDAWIGFENDTYGKFTFGRQNALGRDIVAGYLDPYGAAAASTNEGGGSNTNNFKQMIYYAGSATGTRFDRGAVWKKKFDSGIVAGLGYQAAGATDNAGPHDTTKTAALAYNGGMFNLAGYYTHANVTGLAHDAYSLGGNVTFNKLVRLNAGYFHYTADQGGGVGQRKDNAYTISAKLTPAGQFDYELGYQVMKADNAGYNGSGITLNAFKDTSGVTTTGSGKRSTLYASAFYHFDPQTDVYVAFDYLKLDGGYTQASTHGFDSQTEVATGVRYKF